jgi:transmembrane sensor
MNNGNLGNYTFEDLVTDESFINYCLRNNAVDIKFWQDWITSYPGKRILIEKAEYYVRNFSLTLPEMEYQEELVKITKVVDDSRGVPAYRSVVSFPYWKNPLRISDRKRRSLSLLLLPALIILLAGGYYWMQHQRVAVSDLVENYNGGSVPLVFSLPDGSVITLAPHSGLNYPRKFDPVTRKVYLNGEASFHVTADSVHPFKVYQDDVVATVLGTIFNIRKEHKDSVVVIELIKGRLKVEIAGSRSIPGQSIFLLPNERVIYSKYSRKISKEKWQLEDDLLLRKNHLVFKQDDFNAIANKIKTSFGITLINQSDKKSWRFTGEFNNSTAGEMITSICKIEGLSSEIIGDTILIK